MLKRLLLPSIFLLTLPALASEEIVNGTLVTPQDPITSHVVGIQLKLYIKIIGAKIPVAAEGCTGTLISPHLVLTAAHCASNLSFLKAGEATLYFGVDMSKPVATVKVDAVKVDPAYVAGADENSHDVSLMHFSGNLPAGFSPAQILPDTYVLHTGEEVVSAGYGITNPKLEDSGILRKASFLVHEADYSSDEVSLTENTSGLCHGDSGGPTFVVSQGQDLVWGVTSRLDTRVDPNELCQGGAIVTDVRKEAAFVKAAMKELGN